MLVRQHCITFMLKWIKWINGLNVCAQIMYVNEPASLHIFYVYICRCGIESPRIGVKGPKRWRIQCRQLEAPPLIVEGIKVMVGFSDVQ
jgi:hypothetical protein